MTASTQDGTTAPMEGGKEGEKEGEKKGEREGEGGREGRESESDILTFDSESMY